MPLNEQTAVVGDNFDGTASKGLFALASANKTDDTQRAMLFSVAVQSGEVQTSIIVRLAKSLADANGAGPFIELANVADASGVNVPCCRCIVPITYQLFVITTGGVTTEKYAVVDWYNVTVEPFA